MNNFKNAKYGALGYLFPVIIALGTTPYIVRKLSVEIYGIYALSISVMGFMSFLDFGFGQGIIKYVPHYQAKGNYQRINEIASVSIWLYAAMGLFGAIAIYFCAGIFAANLFPAEPGNMRLAEVSFKLTAVGFLVNFFSGLLMAFPKALQRYDVAIKVQNGVWIASTLSTVMILFSGFGLIGILVSYIIFQLVSVFVLMVVVRGLMPWLEFSFTYKHDVFREIMGYSLYSAVNSICSTIVFRVDKLLVGAFLGAEAVTHYQIPFMIVQISNTLVNSVSQFLFPAVSYINSKGDSAQLRRLYVRATRYVLALSVFMSALLLTSGNDFIRVWMGSAFSEKTAQIVPILAVVYFFLTGSIVAYWFYNGLGRVKVNMFSSLVGSLLYLFASLVFIPRYGLLGAAISFSFILVPFPIYLYVLDRILGGESRWLVEANIKAILVLIAALLAALLLPAVDGVPALMARGAAVAVMVAWAAYRLNLWDSELLARFKKQ